MSNLSNTTRELWDRTKKHQVLMAIPILNAMLARKRVTKGGTYIQKTVQKDDLESLAQEYKMNDPLTSSTKEIYDKPKFKWKYMQVPVERTGEEEVQNSLAGDHRIIDLAKDLVAEGGKAARYKLRTTILGAGSTTSDDDAGFQGLADGLTHGAASTTKYGTLVRNVTTTNEWWQGASIAGTYTDQATARSMNIETVRQCVRVTAKYAHDRKRSDIKIFTSPTNLITLKREMETRMHYNEPAGDLMKQGFLGAVIDSVEIVEDPYLDTSATLKKYFYLVHLMDWEFCLHPKRTFKMTPPVWQGQIVNGTDSYLARVLVTGNMVCWQPNASMFLSNVS